MKMPTTSLTGASLIEVYEGFFNNLEMQKEICNLLQGASRKFIHFNYVYYSEL